MPAGFYVGKVPARITTDDIEEYLLELARRGRSPGTRNVKLAAVRCQVETTYTLLVDGEPATVTLRADYLVSRSGRQFVADGELGGLAPRLDTAPTRRQLLEYWAAFQVDGILLVEGEARQVHEITFSTPSRGKGRDGAYGFALGLALAVAFAFWVFSSNLAFSLHW